MAPNNTKKAEEAVIKEDQWNYHCTNITAAGRKKFFQSNKISRSKKIVQELFELKLKLKAIIEMLHERGNTVPSIHQLNSLLRTVKSRELGPTSISLGENVQWCLESSQSMPKSDDTPFVASYEIIYDKI
ncbi:unnamed protein product [Rotaria socialis]|uniref:Uncharacterized protein n=1 Tax=Rotaria socialis TaxID=392032 RepID=A0A817W2A4_9BILA|nr:unnamed protein product [Rotaria socialis]CAF3347507.1 unnamed protein product [Rotaria socialis]CAF3609946.1 unnamed protein product [Rotaria socialis]CAF4516208.1 unnamed protein product [Rotaria socialis]CAF4570559.1 unnamed protein product [Rotaria socialis]